MEKSYSESYAAAGVDITAGYRSVELMKQYVARTMNEHCIGGLGGFGGLFELGLHRLQAPCSDLRHGRRGHQAEDRHDHGQARHHRHRLRGHVRQRCHLRRCKAAGVPGLHRLRPATFPEKIAEIVKGVAEGCVQADCSLVAARLPSTRHDAGGGVRSWPVSPWALWIKEKI